MALLLSHKKTISDPSGFESRFQQSISFFKQRSPVIFISQHYRFWEQHGFVQQSLAKVLTEAGIPVIWFDGASWRKKRPIQTWHSPYLKVVQLPCLPMRRLALLDSINPMVQLRVLKGALSQGKRPFLWVQGGLDERVVAGLPYIDTFSIFDDPYIHSPDGELSRKAKLIVAQNSFAEEIFKKNHDAKTAVLFPPVDMSSSSFSNHTDLSLPANFPERTMGYIGSFFSRGFDLLLFEDFIKSLPDWGFILCGRTDDLGQKRVESWKKYKNFFYAPWVPRAQVGALWKKINLNLMLYRPEPTSHGAFPVKFLEALHFGVPSLATHVPKTSSLEGIIPRLTFPAQLKKSAVKEALSSNSDIPSLYENFSFQMDPKLHLIRVSEFIRDSML